MIKMDESKVYFELIVISMLLNIPLNYGSNMNETVTGIVCDEGYVLIGSYKQCHRAKRLGELCSFTQQCQYFDNNTYCGDNWTCNIQCQNGQEFNSKIGRCVKKKKTFEMAFKQLAFNLKLKNFTLNLVPNNTRTINVFELLHSTSNYNGVCPFDNRWNEFTQSCEINPFLVNTGTLLLSFGFAVAFIFIILMVYRKRQNESINLLQTLNSFNVSNNQRLGLREPIVYFLSVPNDTLPSYQDVVNSRPSQSVQTCYNSRLPSYEEAIRIS